MEHGPSEEKFRKQAEQNKIALPKWLLDKPSIPFGLGFYFRAYTDLHTCRPIGMSEGAIPWTAVNDYALRHHLSDRDFDELWLIVKGVDALYTGWRAEKNKPTKDSLGGRRPPTRGR